MGDIVGAGLCARPCVVLPYIVIMSETKNLFAYMYDVSAVRRGRRTLQLICFDIIYMIK